MDNGSTTTNGISDQELLAALTALRNGDFSTRLSADGQTGTRAEIAKTYNELGEMLSVLSPEFRRLSRELGTEGRFGPQAEVPGAQGEWLTLIGDFNKMAANLTNQVRNFAQVTTAVARGDLAKKVTVDTQGEMQEWKEMVNLMVDQLNMFASELTRVVRATETSGKTGAQMQAPGVTGTWKDLVENVNRMAGSRQTP